MTGSTTPRKQRADCAAALPICTRVRPVHGECACAALLHSTSSLLSPRAFTPHASRPRPGERSLKRALSGIPIHRTIESYDESYGDRGLESVTPRNGPGCDRFHAISLLFRGWPFPIPDNVLVGWWIVDGSNLFGFSRGRYRYRSLLVATSFQSALRAG